MHNYKSVYVPSGGKFEFNYKFLTYESVHGADIISYKIPTIEMIASIDADDDRARIVFSCNCLGKHFFVLFRQVMFFLFLVLWTYAEVRREVIMTSAFMQLPQGEEGDGNILYSPTAEEVVGGFWGINLCIMYLFVF